MTKLIKWWLSCFWKCLKGQKWTSVARIEMEIFVHVGWWSKSGTQMIRDVFTKGKAIS